MYLYEKDKKIGKNLSLYFAITKVKVGEFTVEENNSFSLLKFVKKAKYILNPFSIHIVKKPKLTQKQTATRLVMKALHCLKWLI